MSYLCVKKFDIFYFEHIKNETFKLQYASTPSVYMYIIVFLKHPQSLCMNGIFFKKRLKKQYSKKKNDVLGILLHVYILFFQLTHLLHNLLSVTINKRSSK